MVAATICKACGIVHDGIAPILDCPETLFDELIDELRHAMDNTERTLQAWVGPSEIGDPCDRALIRKLTLTPEPARSASRPDGWRARVGSAIHTQAEGVFAADHMLGRYLVEQVVDVGDIDGRPVTGHCDLFDTAAGAVWDWKTKSKTRLEEAKRSVRMGRGPGQLYRVQQHLYGRGMAKLGHRVARVGLVFLPRDGNLRDAGYWSEPYDESIAVRALQRCTGLVQLVGMLGKDAALDMFPLCEGEYCDWCLAERVPPPPVPFKAGPLPSTAEMIAAVREACGLTPQGAPMPT